MCEIISSCNLRFLLCLGLFLLSCSDARHWHKRTDKSEGVQSSTHHAAKPTHPFTEFPQSSSTLEGANKTCPMHHTHTRNKPSKHQTHIPNQKKMRKISTVNKTDAPELINIFESNSSKHSPGSPILKHFKNSRRKTFGDLSTDFDLENRGNRNVTEESKGLLSDETSGRSHQRESGTAGKVSDAIQQGNLQTIKLLNIAMTEVQKMLNETPALLNVPSQLRKSKMRSEQSKTNVQQSKHHPTSSKVKRRLPGIHIKRIMARPTAAPEISVVKAKSEQSKHHPAAPKVKRRLPAVHIKKIMARPTAAPEISVVKAKSEQSKHNPAASKVKRRLPAVHIKKIMARPTAVPEILGRNVKSEQSKIHPDASEVKRQLSGVHTNKTKARPTIAAKISGSKAKLEQSKHHLTTSKVKRQLSDVHTNKTTERPTTAAEISGSKVKSKQSKHHLTASKIKRNLREVHIKRKALREILPALSDLVRERILQRRVAERAVTTPPEEEQEENLETSDLRRQGMSLQNQQPEVDEQAITAEIPLQYSSSDPVGNLNDFEISSIPAPGLKFGFPNSESQRSEEARAPKIPLPDTLNNPVENLNGVEMSNISASDLSFGHPDSKKEASSSKVREPIVHFATLGKMAEPSGEKVRASLFTSTDRVEEETVPETTKPSFPTKKTSPSNLFPIPRANFDESEPNTIDDYSQPQAVQPSESDYILMLKKPPNGALKVVIDDYVYKYGASNTNARAQPKQYLLPSSENKNSGNAPEDLKDSVPKLYRLTEVKPSRFKITGQPVGIVDETTISTVPTPTSEKRPVASYKVKPSTTETFLHETATESLVEHGPASDLVEENGHDTQHDLNYHPSMFNKVPESKQRISSPPEVALPKRKGKVGLKISKNITKVSSYDQKAGLFKMEEKEVELFEKARAYRNLVESLKALNGGHHRDRGRGRSHHGVGDDIRLIEALWDKREAQGTKNRKNAETATEPNAEDRQISRQRNQSPPGYVSTEENQERHGISSRSHTGHSMKNIVVRIPAALDDE